MVRGAMNYFDRIQGGKERASPQRAVSSELTQESVKIVVAQVVARLLAIGCVVSAGQARCGD